MQIESFATSKWQLPHVTWHCLVVGWGRPGWLQMRILSWASFSKTQIIPILLLLPHPGLPFGASQSRCVMTNFFVPSSWLEKLLATQLPNYVLTIAFGPIRLVPSACRDGIHSLLYTVMAIWSCLVPLLVSKESDAGQRVPTWTWFQDFTWSREGDRRQAIGEKEVEKEKK